MISIRLVKNIELGPRQMTFGFDDTVSVQLDLVFSFIEEMHHLGGPVPLDLLIDPEMRSADPDSHTDQVHQFHLGAPEHPLAHIGPQDILQTAFWLAEELKVHFFISDKTIPPHQAKQTLIDDPACAMCLVINQPVDDSRFEAAKKLADMYWGALPENSNQYELSRFFVNHLESWQSRLRSFQGLAEQAGVPGSAQIKNCLILVNKLLMKKDSCSVIFACLKYQIKLPSLSDNMRVLTDFYTHHFSFWNTFSRQMEDFQRNIDAIQGNPKMLSIYHELHEILTRPQPFELIEKARQLLPELESFHQQIEREKMESLRKNCLEQTDKMIRKLIALFDTFDTEDESRNKVLHNLRGLNKRIGASTRIQEIDTLFNDAKDLFVDMIEIL